MTSVARRANGQGSIVRRRDGRLMVSIYHDGKRRHRYAYTPEEAEELRREMVAGTRSEVSGKSLEEVRVELEGIEDRLRSMTVTEFRERMGRVRYILSTAIRERDMARRQARDLGAALRNLREVEEWALTDPEGAAEAWEEAMEEADQMLELSPS